MVCQSSRGFVSFVEVVLARKVVIKMLPLNLEMNWYILILMILPYIMIFLREK